MEYAHLCPLHVFGYRRMAYKVHYTIDRGSRIITDCHGTTGSRHECTVMPDRITYQMKRFGLPVEEVIADKGYGRGPTYKQLRELGVYVPTYHCTMTI